MAFENEKREETKEEKFLSLAKYYEELKEKMDEVRTQLDEAMADVGVDTYVQDPETSLVYKVVQPKGRYVYYHSLDFVRTAKEGERAGSLSKKEAEEAGFVLKKA